MTNIERLEDALKDQENLISRLIKDGLNNYICYYSINQIKAVLEDLKKGE